MTGDAVSIVTDALEAALARAEAAEADRDHWRSRAAQMEVERDRALTQHAHPTRRKGDEPSADDYRHAWEVGATPGVTT